MNIKNFIPSAGIEAEKLWERLLEPEIVTEGQWADLRRASETTPEKRLLLAILDDALHIAGQGITPNASQRKKQIYAEAMDWIMGAAEVDPEVAFSCEDVCDYLGIDILRLREVIRNKQFVAPEGRRYRRSANATCRPAKARVLFQYQDQEFRDRNTNSLTLRKRRESEAMA